MRINVIGTSSSGKSTLSKRIARALDIPYIEIDRIYWGPNWTEPSDEEFLPKLEAAIDQPNWVLDGNYSRSNQIKWRNVEIIVWVDLYFARTLYQAVSRAVCRLIDSKELWPETGNRESLRKLFSRDSIVLWTLKSFYKNRRRYAQLMVDERYNHIRFVRIRSRSEMDRFVEKLQAEVLPESSKEAEIQ